MTRSANTQELKDLLITSNGDERDVVEFRYRVKSQKLPRSIPEIEVAANSNNFAAIYRIIKQLTSDRKPFDDPVMHINIALLIYNDG